MNIIIFNKNNSNAFKELDAKIARNGWNSHEYKVSNAIPLNKTTLFSIIYDADYVIFGSVYTTKLKKIADLCQVMFKKWGKPRNRILHFNSDGEKFFIKYIYSTRYVKKNMPWDDEVDTLVNGLSVDEEPCYPEYQESISDIQKKHYSVYIKLYDLEYPTDNLGWLHIIEQIDWYINNQLEFCVSEEDAERIINNYEAKAELSPRDKSVLRRSNLEYLI